MSSDFGDYTTPCPNCGGVVHYWSFDPDCSGSDGYSYFQCTSCKREFTRAEWSIIAKDEIRKTKRARALSDMLHYARDINKKITQSPEILSRLEAKLKAEEPIGYWEDAQLQLFFMTLQDLGIALQRFEKL